MIIAEVIGWLATALRAGGMLSKSAGTVKLLVTGGNVLWAVNGAMTGSVPLVVCNVICAVIFIAQLYINRKERINGTE